MVEYKMHQYVLRALTIMPLRPSECEQILKKEICELKYSLAKANKEIAKLKKQRAKKRRLIEYDLLKKIKVLDLIFDKIDLNNAYASSNKEDDKVANQITSNHPDIVAQAQEVP